MIKKIVLFLFLLNAISAFSQSVFVWDNDLDYTVMNPEDPWTFVGMEFGIIGALNENGITPSVDTQLPDDLSIYDMIFATIGIWCDG
jgi:hypothetical protein